MKKFFFSLVALIATLGSNPAEAQEDRNVVIMRKLYSKIEGLYTLGENTPRPEQNFLVLANPGYFVQKDLDLVRRPADRRIFSSFVNTVPLVSWIYKESPRTVSGIYESILNGKETPLVELKQEQRKALADAKAKIWINGNHASGETKGYKEYKDLKDKWGKAYDELTTAKEKAYTQGTGVPRTIINEEVKARNEYELVKHDIDKAFETIRELGALDPKTWWLEKSNIFQASKETSGVNSFLPSVTVPSYSAWIGNQGWESRTITESEVLTHQTSSHVDYGGGVSAGWGLLRAGGNASYSQNNSYSNTDAKNFTLKFETMRVRIERDWMDFAVFENRAWRWIRTSGMANRKPISNGVDPLEGDMPLYVTGLLLARNVELTADWTQAELTTFDSHLSTSASVGWGPFSLKGHYNKDDASSTSLARKNGNTIINPDVQIIGYYCYTMPACPFPDPSLKWSTPLALRDIASYNPALLIKEANKMKSIVNFINPPTTVNPSRTRTATPR